jgi:hypothetical protein
MKTHTQILSFIYLLFTNLQIYTPLLIFTFYEFTNIYTPPNI